MEERKYKFSEIEVLYNTYGRFIYMIRRENKIDGNVLFYELGTDEAVDLENYAIHGYYMLKDKGTFLNRFGEYTEEELRDIESVFESIDAKKRDIPREFLVDLNWLMDSIEQNKYNYDMPYPVEKIEIRYSEVLEDYIFLYVQFDHTKKKLTYMDMGTGRPLDDEILSLYTYYPRDEILKQETYTPRETIELRVKLNQDKRSLGKKV